VFAPGPTVTSVVGLSEADAEKWTPLLRQTALGKSGASAPPSPPVTGYRLAVKTIRQHQKRLDYAEIAQLIAEYQAGASTYQLATRFGIHRTTVTHHLRTQGIQMRWSNPT
jgi:DNA invertase Pin-like site-specific DNA recombinase